MNITRRLVVTALALALVAACKKDGDDSAPTGKPLITKKYDDVTKEDLNAAITALGWAPGQSSNSSSGKYSNIMVTARKDAKTAAPPKLVVVIFKMPAAEVAEEQKRKATEYATDVQGGAILGVKYDPADPAASAKTLARLLGK